jgi:ribosomal protein S19
MLIENILYFLKKKKYDNNGFFIKSYNRNMKVNNNIINNYIAIYNGKFFIPIGIKINMLNYYLGSFIFTKNIDLNKIVKKFNKKKKKK